MITIRTSALAVGAAALFAVTPGLAATGLACAGTRAGPQARAKASVPVSPAHMSLWLTSPHRVERCVAMNVSVT